MDNNEVSALSAFENDDDNVVGNPAKAVPKPQREIGIDTSDSLFSNIISAGESSQLDMSGIEGFTQVSQSREQIYRLLDDMSEDSTIAAVIETYAEDATEYNDAGQIMWVESSNAEIAKHVGFLLDAMNVDKNIYKWAYSLCKYGDLYLRLFRESDMKDTLFDNANGDNDKDSDTKPTLNENLESSSGGEPMQEDVRLKAYGKNDRYANYIEMVPNPAEMFELTRFGKTYAYIKADVSSLSKEDNYQFPKYRYNLKKHDVTIYSAKDFVHACLEDNSTRNPEEVELFYGDDDDDKNATPYTYTVKRGQSLFYSVFKIWRQLKLLENSVLLNRITKSSIVRVIGVEVGDMDRTSVQQRLRSVKNLIEQKSALNESESMAEYTNPGPIENNIYVATRDGVGAVTTQQIGGDVDVKSLADLDYFKNKFFGAMRVPKQYFGDTEDGAGFNGGQSLSIISSRYAKMIKRIQNTLIQAITDVINLMLLDRGLGNYINKFTLHMLPPTTQEEIDRRDNVSSKVQLASDIMNMVSEIENPQSRLKILKSLIANIITDNTIIDIIQKEIERLEDEGVSEDEGGEEIESGMGGLPHMSDHGIGGMEDIPTEENPSGEENTPSESEIEPEAPTENAGGADNLPSPEDLGIDMTDNSQF